MPNFWAYYDLTQYNATPVGGPIRYAYDAQVIQIKQSPPANYTYFLPSGAPMPHDDLVTYYSHHAKVGAGKYRLEGGKYIEDINGPVTGTYPFLRVDTTAPSVPTGLAATRTDRSVTLTWTASTDNVGVTGYQVFRNGTQVGTPTSTSYTDSGLSSNTAYSYTVKARDAAGNTSAASSALSVTTSTSGATVTFNVTASTVVGQNVYVVGSVAALGSWSPANAILLSAANYPTWSAAVGLPGSTAVEYKFIKKDAANNVTWESGANRTLTTPATGTSTVNDTWR
ncbi:CBM20 domain-containing protein [Corallococcus interemptor]|uniref:CBM20 domain-containing protein n=1 Tax=Corallococcus interemptor TaxID=2316720 RepID=UPI00351A127D